MGNRRLTYEDLCAWLDAESMAFDQEREGRWLGRRVKDGEPGQVWKSRSFLTSGPANAELVAEIAARDRKTILAYRRADWPKSAWLPFMRDRSRWPKGYEPTEAELESEFRKLLWRRFGRGGRHKGPGEIMIDLLERGSSLHVNGIDASMSDQELASALGVSVKTIRRRKVRNLL